MFLSHMSIPRRNNARHRHWQNIYRITMLSPSDRYIWLWRNKTAAEIWLSISPSLKESLFFLCLFLSWLTGHKYIMKSVFFLMTKCTNTKTLNNTTVRATKMLTNIKHNIPSSHYISLLIIKNLDELLSHTRVTTH